MLFRQHRPNSSFEQGKVFVNPGRQARSIKCKRGHQKVLKKACIIPSFVQAVHKSSVNVAHGYMSLQPKKSCQTCFEKGCCNFLLRVLVKKECLVILASPQLDALDILKAFDQCSHLCSDNHSNNSNAGPACNNIAACVDLLCTRGEAHT